MAATLVAIAVVEWSGPMAAPSLSPLYLVAVVVAAFAGGIGPSLVCSALALAHAASYRFCPRDPAFHQGCFAVGALTFGAPLAALLVGFLKNATERHIDEAREAARDLAEAQRIGEVGSWRLRPGENVAVYSDEMRRLQGIRPEDTALEAWLDRVHPEDRRRVQEFLARAAAAGGGRCEYRGFRSEHDERIFALRARKDLTGQLRGTIHDLTAEKAALEVDAIIRRDALQRELVANVSHEFRTPLAAIQGCTESLQTGAGDDPAVREEFLDIIVRHTKRLALLVDSLLSVAALESGARPPQPEPIDLSEFLSTLTAELEQLARRQKIELKAECPGGCVAKADREQLTQMLHNLCANGVKFNHEGGRVLVSAQPEGTMIAVRVRDTGPGIPEDQQPHLFERFSQRRQPRPGVGGSGLGLSIAASLAAANGGALSLERSDSSGSSFLLTIPVASALLAVA